MKYYFNQKVRIIKGFYNTYKGFIVEFSENTNKYKIQIDDERTNAKINVFVDENEIRPLLLGKF